MPRITGAHILRAEAETEWHRSQIQSFLYSATDDRQDHHQHVVRDLTKPAVLQTLHMERATKDDYAAASARCIAASEAAKAQVLADQLNAIINEEATE